jgi:hypothetical protein
MWRLEIALAVIALSLSSIGIHRWRRALPASTAAAQQTPTVLETPRLPSADALDEAAGTATDQNPFRLSRMPSDVPFVPRRAASAMAPAAPAFRGALTLRGIVGGPPWQAVIDGIPGQPSGTVVRAGSTFEKLTIRSVTRDTVIIQSPDTIWRLTLGRGGQ